MQFEQLCKKLNSSKEQKPTLSEALSFLSQSVAGDVPLYVVGNGFYIYTVLVPSNQLVGDYTSDLMQWNFGVPSGWGYGYSSYPNFEDVEFFISPPLDETGSRILDKGEPTFLWRDFIGNGVYFEINQRLTHVLDIHLCIDGTKRLYQRINNNGDFENIAIAYRDDLILCTLRDIDLELYEFGSLGIGVVTPIYGGWRLLPKWYNWLIILKEVINHDNSTTF